MESRKPPLVLLIDDDELLLKSTARLLKHEGYAVECHTGGFGATQVIAELKPDLVLLDMNMPALSGPSVVEILKCDDRIGDAKVVFFSSSDEGALRDSVSEVGADGYICKGDLAELRHKVRSYLSGRTRE